MKPAWSLQTSWRRRRITVIDDLGGWSDVFRKGGYTNFHDTTKAPTWDLLSASEKKIKSIFASEYPLFKDVRPINNQGSISQSDKDAISQEYRELRFNKWSQSETFLRDTASYMEDPVLLDVLAVTWVIDEIIWFWDRRFAQYFDNDDSWKGKLSEIRRVRNPMAHAHGDCISEDDLAKTNRYMQELLGLGI